MTEADCEDVVRIAISTSGTAEQINSATCSASRTVICKEKLSFEVAGVEMADDTTRAQFQAAREKVPFRATLGKLHCRRWTYPLARRYDLSDDGLKKSKVEETFTLWLEEDILENCFSGLKLEGVVFELDNGVKWLDSCSLAGPSFFEILPNDFYDEQKAFRREKRSPRYGDYRS